MPTQNTQSYNADLNKGPSVNGGSVGGTGVGASGSSSSSSAGGTGAGKSSTSARNGGATADGSATTGVAVSAGGDTVVLHDYGFAVRFVRGKGAIVTFVDVDGQVAISIHLSSRAVNISSWCSSFSS